MINEGSQGIGEQSAIPIGASVSVDRRTYNLLIYKERYVEERTRNVNDGERFIFMWE